MARRAALPDLPPPRVPRPPLEAAADAAGRAPSVHGTRPWRAVLHPGRLELVADLPRQLAVPDPVGRARARSVGAALFDARVALAAAGSAVRVDRLPDPTDPGVVAVLRPVDGPPDPVLAALAPAVRRGHADPRRLEADRVPEDVLRLLVAAAAAEETVLVPVTREEHLRLVARLAQQAGRGPAPDTDRTLLVLATHRDDLRAWLRCGEALERVLLELTARGWGGEPLPRLVEVPVTRTQLRSALSWDAHPQVVLRTGRAPVPAPTPRRPVPDGHGGTTWV
ncbi:hypothetical protein ACI8AV_20550 [Geodermatophilus sp. SYSU D00804]